MLKSLNEKAVTQFHQAGYYFPVRVLDDRETADRRALLEHFEAAQGASIGGTQRNKSHLLFKWVDDLMRDPGILDAVEDLIGPDILCWNTVFWTKEPGSRSFVSWHQDLRYWGLETEVLVTVWLALSPATPDSGCMRVLPGSHRGDLLPHKDQYQADNLLTRGQEIAVQVEETEAVAMPLRAGDMSLHHVRLAHASGPNRSHDRRIGLSMQYMPPDTRQVIGEWDSAALVRGQDRFGHFTHAPIPTRDFDPVAVEFHRRASRAVREIVYKDAQQVRPTL